MQTTEITIFATDEVARKFILFQKYYEIFSLLVDRGVFNTKNGTIAMDFDKDGVLQDIKRADFLYSRRFEAAQNRG